MTPKRTHDIEAAADREITGVGSQEYLEASLRAVQAGLADIAAGRTRPFRAVLAELGRDA